MSLPFTVQCRDGWCDVTHELETVNPPWTLAKPDGVGAFQFSVGVYKKGEIPNPSPLFLLSMLRDSAKSYELGEPVDIITGDGNLRIAAGSFRRGEEFFRVWYASDGHNFAKITYTCLWGVRQTELSDCEQMVRTLRFTDGKP